jgi:hypothetical protein
VTWAAEINDVSRVSSMDFAVNFRMDRWADKRFRTEVMMFPLMARVMMSGLTLTCPDACFKWRFEKEPRQ